MEQPLSVQTYLKACLHHKELMFCDRTKNVGVRSSLNFLSICLAAELLSLPLPLSSSALSDTLPHLAPLLFLQPDTISFPFSEPEEQIRVLPSAYYMRQTKMYLPSCRELQAVC